MNKEASERNDIDQSSISKPLHDIEQDHEAHLVKREANPFGKSQVLLIATLCIVIFVIVGFVYYYIGQRSGYESEAKQEGAIAENNQESEVKNSTTIALETFQNQYLSLKLPAGWQSHVWEDNSVNQEYQAAFHPAESTPIHYPRLSTNADRIGELGDVDTEGIFVSIKDNIVYLTLALQPKEYAKAVALSGKPVLNIAGMPAAKNVYRETIEGVEYVSQYVYLPLYRNAEARSLQIVYRMPVSKFNVDEADAVMQSLQLNRDFWNNLNVDEAQAYYDEHDAELRAYNEGYFITGENLLTDGFVDIASGLGLRDPKQE